MDRIVVDAGIHFGKPCVAGTRIPVQDVLELVDQELPFNQIIQDYYPELTAADIHACIRYAIALVGAEDIRLRGGTGLRFLLDQDVYASTARYLARLGHDVLRASDIGLSRAADEKLLETAQKQDRLFVTRDRDFGRIVFLNRNRAGILYLRMEPAMQHAVHEVLEDVLRTNPEEVLAQAFVAITPGGYRIRTLTDRQ